MICEYCYREVNTDVGWDWIYQSAVCPQCVALVARHGGYENVRSGEFADGRPDPRGPFFSSFGSQYMCPVCGFSYVGFRGFPHRDDGHDNYRAWEGRGDCVSIPFMCENGHCWTLRIGQHKGEMFMKAVDIGVVDEEELGVD